MLLVKERLKNGHKLMSKRKESNFVLKVKGYLFNEGVETKGRPPQDVPL